MPGNLLYSLPRSVNTLRLSITTGLKPGIAIWRTERMKEDPTHTLFPTQKLPASKDQEEPRNTGCLEPTSNRGPSWDGLGPGLMVQMLFGKQWAAFPLDSAKGEECPHSITERPQMGRAGIPKGPASSGHPAHCYSGDSHLPEAITGTPGDS